MKPVQDDVVGSVGSKLVAHDPSCPGDLVNRRLTFVVFLPAWGEQCDGYRLWTVLDAVLCQAAVAGLEEVKRQRRAWKEYDPRKRKYRQP